MTHLTRVLSLLIASITLPHCMTSQDRVKIDKDIFQIQTRLLELEGQVDEGGKQQKNRGDANSRQIASTASRLETFDQETRRIWGDIDMLKVALRTGELPGRPEGSESLATVIQRLQERMATLEQTQALILQRIDANQKKKKKPSRRAIKSLRQIETAFKKKRYLHIVEDAPILIENLKGKDKSQARYRYAESLFRLGRLSDAALAFNALLSEKTLDQSLLPRIKMRIGDSFRLLGDREIAKVYYSELIEQFPQSSSAELAKKRLAAVDSASPVKKASAE